MLNPATTPILTVCPVDFIAKNSPNDPTTKLNTPWVFRRKFKDILDQKVSLLFRNDMVLRIVGFRTTDDSDRGYQVHPPHMPGHQLGVSLANASTVAQQGLN